MIKILKQYKNESETSQSVKDDNEVYQIVYHDGTINCYQDYMMDYLVENNIFSEVATVDIVSEGGDSLGDFSIEADKLSLGAGESISLPEGISAKGELWISDNSEYSTFFISALGTVDMRSGTANIVNTDTSNKLCIVDDGTNVKIINNFSEEKEIIYKLEY